MEKKEDHYQLIAHSNLLNALACLSRCEDLLSAAVPLGDLDLPEFSPGSEETLAGRAKKFIHQNFDTRFDLEALAKALFTNKSHLCHEFKQETGISVIEYLTKVRVDASKRLLLTDIKIAVIAKLVGFDDPYYFSRVFKKITGIPPVEYKTRHENGDLER